jgi:MFS family permease
LHIAERVEDIGFYAGFVGNQNFPNDYNVPTSKPSYMHVTNYLIYSLRELVKCHICIFVGASYMLGRALTSTAWGMIADRIGRKPVIILAIISTLVFMFYFYIRLHSSIFVCPISDFVFLIYLYFRLLFNTLFGLSVKYWMAIATRFLLGSLNGLLGPIRVRQH